MWGKKIFTAFHERYSRWSKAEISKAVRRQAHSGLSNGIKVAFELESIIKEISKKENPKRQQSVPIRSYEEQNCYTELKVP